MPVAPLVVPFIFPSKVFIYFGKPIYFENDVHKESDIKDRVDTVKAAINDLLQQGLARREEYQRAQKEKNKKV